MTALTVVDGQAEAARYNEAFIMGDLSALTEPQRLEYYLTVCKSLGLNPATRPLEFLKLQGNKLTLYARKDCTDQLRALKGVSISRPTVSFDSGLCLVTIDATDKHGRQDSDLGIVTIGNLQGDARANAIMKAVTKAKRRVTLSICGLGILDESEIETIPGAERVPMNLSTGAWEMPATEPEPTPQESSAPQLTNAQIAALFAHKAQEFQYPHEGKHELRFLATTLLGKEPADVYAYQDAVRLSDEHWKAAVQKAAAEIAELTVSKDTLMDVAPADRTLEAMAL